jgi:hypothetical protein
MKCNKQVFEHGRDGFVAKQLVQKLSFSFFILGVSSYLFLPLGATHSLLVPFERCVMAVRTGTFDRRSHETEYFSNKGCEACT